MVINKSGFFSSNFVCEECGLDFNNQNRAEEHEIECRRNPLIKTIINSPLGTEGYVQETHSYTETDGIYGCMLRDSVRFPGEYPDFDILWKMCNDWGEILISCPKCSSTYFVDKDLKTRVGTNSRVEAAKYHEKLLEFDEAANIYKKLGMDDELIRIRKLKSEQGAVKVSQKIVHGDEITKTDIRDSVLNRSNVGGGSSKMQELEKLTEMKKEGLISDEEYEKMKQEIIG